MDNYSLQIQENPVVSTDACDDRVEFQVNNSHENTEQPDVHAFLEMRVAELWKKLEETNDNLNSCDTMLETYCKVVSEKLNQKICSRCQRHYFSNDSGGDHSNIVASKMEWPPTTLLEKITKILKNVQNSFYTMNVKETHEGNEMEIHTNNNQSYNGTAAFCNDFYVTLKEVLDKVVFLEECLKELGQKRYYESSQKEINGNGIKSGYTEKVFGTKLYGDLSQVKDSKNEGTAMECKDEVNSTEDDAVCFVLSVIIFVMAAEETSNVKHQKREILVFGHGTGYSFGHPNNGFGFTNVGHGTGLGFEHGHGFGYDSPLARMSIIPLAPHIAAAPVARTLTPLGTIHTPTLSLAASLKAQVPSTPISAVIAAPITSFVPTPFGYPYPTAVVAHRIPTAVHITEPITSSISPSLSAPITTVKLEIPKPWPPKTHY